MVVAAASRKRCGLSATPKAPFVLARTRSYRAICVIGEPSFETQSPPSTGRVQRPALAARRGRWIRRSDLLISGLRVEGSDRRNSGSRQLVVQKMGFATVDR